ncbi:small-conductance mechanosensitive channel [Methylohalomonas lacus]|uniref:Small-conductance mechanosensitive channel n=1 Tax=Methylohalomonas lacus TaxID=398773 RepID=A0AAE3HKZ7_9GAMM|nr:mechanosensitive ion channel domain-containing protein [Methylohalomonas lacus]MCS3903044.1 small-conductance mechanosensitive channel [Methylohalomonas lacus]
MDLTTLELQFDQVLVVALNALSSPPFYVQLGLVLVALLLAYWLAHLLRNYSPLLMRAPTTGAWLPLKKLVYQAGELLFPLLVLLALGIVEEISQQVIAQVWLVRVCQGLAVVFLFYSIITRFVPSPFIKTLFKWVLIPIAILHIFDWLDDVTAFLDGIDFELGNIRLSAYGLLRVFIFGSILFWLGRISNNVGQQIIRKQETLDLGTREVFAKLFEVLLFMVIFVLLLQILGVNLTALAVFGGALGVGLGFGLQAIASNFISGIIILLDRSIKVGDYIELDDGNKGRIRKLNMRSAFLETFDGKDVVVPNEQFVTTRFINWTQNNEKQRYSLEFQVAYSTDIPKMLDIVKQTVRSHPQVINEPDTPIEELADAEISGFGDSGIDILVEFWMEGIDDGKNRVGADLLLMIWQALRDNGIEIPFPQREVRLLNDPQPGG